MVFWKTVGKAETRFTFDVWCYALKTFAGKGIVASIHQRFMM